MPPLPTSRTQPCPVAGEEIVNLGENQRTALRQAQGEITALTNANKAAYTRAYCYLRAAEEMEALWAQINGENVNKEGVSRFTTGLLQELSLEQLSAAPVRRERHLFASAITPVGLVSHIGTLLKDYTRSWVLRCAPGTGGQEVFSTLINAARLRGVYMEVFHRPLFRPKSNMCSSQSLERVVSQDEFSPGRAQRK